MANIFGKIWNKIKSHYETFAKGFKQGSENYENATKGVNISGSKTFLMIATAVAVFSLFMGNPWPICGLLAIPLAEKCLLPGASGLIGGFKSLFGGAAEKKATAQQTNSGAAGNAYTHTEAARADNTGVRQVKLPTPSAADVTSAETKRPSASSSIQAALMSELLRRTATGPR